MKLRVIKIGISDKFSPTVYGRDVFEVADQLEGYVDETTPNNIKDFLLREGNYAGDLGDAICHLATLLKDSFDMLNAVRTELEEYEQERTGEAYNNVRLNNVIEQIDNTLENADVD